ncbi:MAG: outer membrane lipid asymmetry maintenance protein MlaD [Magnetococcus sp. WYHC-3]
MGNRIVETVVGLFVVLGLLAMGWLSVRLARMELVGGEYYSYHAVFSSISGLRLGAPVEVAGVQVGRVDSIRLDPKTFMADVELKVERDIPIQDDAVAAIRTKGLIGDRYVLIVPGISEELLPPGQRFLQTQPALNLEDLIGQFIHGGGIK